jgi:hypothetical protein
MGEVGDRDLDTADHTGQLPGFLVGPFQELFQQPKLVQDFERGGVDRIAAEIPQEVTVLLEDHDVDTGPRQQEAQHYARGSATRDAAGRLQFRSSSRADP